MKSMLHGVMTTAGNERAETPNKTTLKDDAANLSHENSHVIMYTTLFHLVLTPVSSGC
jgi:hypothetical protein